MIRVQFWRTRRGDLMSSPEREDVRAEYADYLKEQGAPETSGKVFLQGECGDEVVSDMSRHNRKNIEQGFSVWVPMAPSDYGVLLGHGAWELDLEQALTAGKERVRAVQHNDG